MLIPRVSRLQAIAACIAAIAAVPLFAEGAAEESAAAADQVEITWMHAFFGEYHDEGEILEEAVNESVEGVNVDVVMLPNREMEERYNLMIASGDLPNIMPIYRDTEFFRFARDGVFASLNDYLPWDEAKYPNLAEYFPMDLLEKATHVDGNYYGIYKATVPVERMLAIRTDWLENLGLEPPTTMDELLEVARAFTYEDPDGDGEDNTWGLAVSKNLAEPMWWMNGSFHVNYIDTWHFYPAPEDSPYEFVEPSLWQPGIKETIAFLRKAYAEGVIVPDSITLNYGPILREYFRANRLGMLGVNTAAGFEDMGVDIIPPPSGPFGEPRVPRRSPVWRNYVVTSVGSDAQVEASVRIFDWLLSPAGQELVKFGKEGVHFTERRADGTPIPNMDVPFGNLHYLPYPPEDPYVDLTRKELGTPQAAERVKDEQTWLSYSIEIPTNFMTGKPESHSRVSELFDLVWGTSLAVIAGDRPLSAVDEMIEEANRRLMIEVTEDMNEAIRRQGIR